MPNLIVVNNPKRWPFTHTGAEVVSARHYLSDPKFSDQRGVKVFNLCSSYRYQSLGYYVSLLAAARDHRPIPSIETIQDMKSLSILRLISDDLDELIQRSLKPLQSDRFTLSIYFGRNMAKRYERLADQLSRLFQSPLLRAEFRYLDNHWALHRIYPITIKEVVQEHYGFVTQAAEEFFASAPRAPRRKIPRYDLAILVSDDEENPPSNDRALKNFARAAKRADLGVEFIDKDDYGSIPEFDALFIRETTNVDHHTYRFSRRAAAEGLVVIDDPASIQLCTNKVFLAELLSRHRISHPRTMIVHRDNKTQVQQTIGLPCILKMPDSSFSQGVFKAEDPDSLHRIIERLLDDSDLIIAQEYTPTPFDWRVGVLNRKPIYVCKYFMASDHWQIQKNEMNGETRYGDVASYLVEESPPAVVKTALRAANLIGDGLYGVDLKQIGDKVYVIEINDNPSIDAGFEDAKLKDALYDQIISVFVERIEKRKAR
ncbi:MAG: ATP-grasp domain-containing protein [bacterium]|nr:ATP-grasp domain-containing protein [bacterium]